MRLFPRRIIRYRVTVNGRPLRHPLDESTLRAFWPQITDITIGRHRTAHGDLYEWRRVH